MTANLSKLGRLQREQIENSGLPRQVNYCHSAICAFPWHVDCASGAGQGDFIVGWTTQRCASNHDILLVYQLL